MAQVAAQKARGLRHVALTRILPRLVEEDHGFGTPCQIWRGGVNSKGYGTVSVHGITRYVHRVIYVVFVGPLPEGYFVCHRCDVRRCCHPEHLFKGTAMENHVDMKAKCRAWIFGKPPQPLIDDGDD